tara:strand:- start:5820 stop:6560 length:741 start_codon:yes stop_codon:yes gene_type:complete
MFYCISFYDGDLEILNHIENDDFIIYAKGKTEVPGSERLANYGYNLSSYFTFIIDNYDDLPKRIGFLKNNVFPRHVTKDTFIRSLLKSDDFVGIEEPKTYSHKQGVSYFDSKDGFFEINNSWYLTSKRTKYFYSFNHFMNSVFTNYNKRAYVNFVPGANFILDRDLIRKFPKNFYYNLNLFMKHNEYANESHLIERAMKIIFTEDLKINDIFKSKLSEGALNSMGFRTFLLRKMLLVKPLNKFFLL